MRVPRKPHILFILVLALTCSVSGCAFNAGDSAPPPTTADYVDLERYTGLWYEIARLPNRFQRYCIRNTTATYTLLDNGNIAVLNRCIDKYGEPIETDGLARVVDRSSNARLEVSFVNLFGLQLFWGDYWIIDLGKQYEYAVVGTPNRKYGWVLSRTPNLDEAILKRIYTKLREQGYNPQKFENSPQ